MPASVPRIAPPVRAPCGHVAALAKVRRGKVRQVGRSGCRTPPPLGVWGVRRGKGRGKSEVRQKRVVSQFELPLPTRSERFRPVPIRTQNVKERPFRSLERHPAPPHAVGGENEMGDVARPLGT